MGNASSQYSASDLFTMCMGPRWKVALDESKLKTATWNIAAVNNNPFEYWVTHEDAAYNTLMQGVESFIDQPGASLPSYYPSPRFASPRLDQPGAARPRACTHARAQPHPPRPAAAQASATCLCRKSSRRRCGRSSRR